MRFFVFAIPLSALLWYAIFIHTALFVIGVITLAAALLVNDFFKSTKNIDPEWDGGDPVNYGGDK